LGVGFLNNFQIQINRLQEWVALAEEVVAHEFPSWHLFAAFQVFHLSESKETEEHEKVLRNLERLAKTFKVSPDTLKREFTQVQPTATALKKSAGLTNREAWRQAILRVGHRRPQQKAGGGALFSVLAGYQAWRLGLHPAAASSNCSAIEEFSDGAIHIHWQVCA